MAGRYPYTIDNGGGERLTFSEVRSDGQGEYQEATNSVSPGSGPPMHVHHLQEESLTVERGTMVFLRVRIITRGGDATSSLRMPSRLG